MNCPYTKRELTLALVNAADKLLAFEKKHGEDALQKLEEVCPAFDNAAVTKNASAHHGITAEQLVNSPNYDKLKQEYIDHEVQKGLDQMKQALDLTDPEAWALVLFERLMA